MSALEKFTCKHEWHPSGYINYQFKRDLCLNCDSICVRDHRDKIWYYSYPVDIGAWEGQIEAYE